jgi:alpha-tubulin suppressor-like RCC1 family protein
MSFLNDKTKFTVKTSNLSTVARFSSTLDDAYFLILANNSNYHNYGCNNSAAVFGANSASNFEAYIGIAKNNIIEKLARFNNTSIDLNTNVVVTGNVVPSSNITYNLGTPEYKWKDLYLSGSTIYLGGTILSSDPSTGSLSIKNDSNEIAPMITSKLKLLSSGTTSNYSVFTSTDYGINLTFFDENNNEINHLDLGQADTSFLPEGSNLYYTFERFDERLLTKTLDNIIDGTSNRYIVNDVYNRDLHVTGSLVASNLVVYGDRTTLNTETYQTEQLEISSDTNGPVLTIKQYGSNDILQIYSGSNLALLINNQGFVGINTSNPQYELDVIGIANATYFRGDGSQLWNVNLVDRDTSLLAEGSNLYYTSERVGIIATSSNIDSSNYIQNTSNEISTRLTDTSNLISDKLTDTSNLISNRLTDTSNLISDRLTDTSNLISDRLTDTSNLISNRITDTSNLISDRITNLTTSEIAEGNNLYYTIERFDERLLTKTLDNIYNGTSNKYIINDVYSGDLHVTGNLTASNLIVNGTFTTLDTVTYQAKKMEIISDSEAPALLVRQSGLSNIMEVYDDSNIVLSILNDGYVGINKIDPQYTLDVVGTLNATYFIGNGVGLYNVNLSDRNTSLLAEGSNLYYTSERVGIISTSSNMETSNYILSTSNYISNELTNTSNKISDDMLNVSNLISDRITNLSTNEIAEGNNLYYTAQRFDDRLDSKTADYIADGTSNRYIVFDIYNSDLTVTGTLTASNLVVQGDITNLNTNTYQTERMEIISDIAGPALKVIQRSTLTSNYIAEVTSNYTIEYGSNYSVDNSSNYSIEYTSNYSIDDSSNYTVEYTSNYNVEYSSNYSIELTSNYVIEYTSNYGDNESSNYTIEYTSNYEIAETSNYTVEYSSNYNIDYTSNYTSELSSNYSIEYTSNYLLILTSNYYETFGSNYFAECTSNYGGSDIVHIYDDSNIAMSIVESGMIGINTLKPLYNLDVLGTTRASYFIGDASGLSNVYLADRNTSMLVEGSNLYYTSERVGVIATSSNMETSNYILTTSNYLIAKITDTSNLLTDTINNVVSVEISNTCNYLILTSNLLIQNITQTSNTLTYEINETINNEIATTVANLEYTSNELLNLITSTSNELTNLMNNVVSVQVANSANELSLTSNQLMTNIIATSNQLTDTINNVVNVQITNASNFIVNTSNLLTGNLANYYNVLSTRIDNLTTNNIPEGSNLYYTDARFNAMLLSKSLDDIRDGTSNRYIINDIYSGDLYVTGTLSTSNLIVNGNTTVLNTTTYQSKKLEIVSDAIGPALKVQQNGIFDIMQVYDDSNIVLAIVNGGRVGINTSNPLYTMDVIGTTRATYLIGDGAGLTNVNLLDRNTSMLVEGSNLYYTSARVGVIATASNIDTSNYILNSSNVISNRITNVSNQLSTDLLNTSNNLYNRMIQNSNFISNNLFVTSNYLMNALLTTSNLALNTSNEIMTNLINTYNIYTSNFLANSNLLASNITVTSNNIANLVQFTYQNITTNITDTSNILIDNSVNTSNSIINNTSNTFVILSNNLNNVSNLLASNIPLVYNALYTNLYNVSNIISTQINNASNVISLNITNNSNLFSDRILNTSNEISTRITLTSNEFSQTLIVTSNVFNDLVQLNSNQIYTYFNETSNRFSTDILYNSNVISNRITALNLDMISPGSSNTYIVNNIYDANLTITGRLVVDSLDVIDLGLLEINEDGDYINTDMKSYVARITSNVLSYAPAIIINASNNFDVYDIRQSNYVSTKQDRIIGAASTILSENLLPGRVLVSTNTGKIAASSILSSNLDMLATLNAPVQTQLNNLNINSSNLALSILDRVSFLNNNIGLSTGGTGNNLSVTNVVTTCNVMNYDPLLHLKFEDLSDSSKYASKNFLLMKPYSAYTNHTKDLMLWYKFNGNTNNYVNSINSNLYLINGIESYSFARTNGISSASFNGYTSYTMGLYNINVVPSGIRYVNNTGISISFWFNPSSIFTGRQYIFSFSTSNILNADCAIEAYLNTSNVCLSVSKGTSASVYNMPFSIQSNIFYNVTWEIGKNNGNVNTVNSNIDATWSVYINGLNYSNIIGSYPLDCNYIYNKYGGQVSVYGSNFFNGMIDDFRVYNKLLTDSEIYENAGMNYPGYDLHVNDLLLWYNFDGHLNNFDGKANYVLSLGAGTLTFLQNKITSLYTSYLNGSSRFIMSTNSAINFNTISTIFPRGLTFNFTFSAINVTTATQYLFCLTDTQNSTTPTRSIEVYLTTNQMNFRIRQNGTTTMQTVTLNTNLVAYKYYNVSWVIIPGSNDTTASWYIYLNGANIYTMEVDRYYPVSGLYSHNHFGALYNINFFTGYLDDFRVYIKALSIDEVGRISTNNLKYAIFTGHTNNLISWFNFDSSYNNTMYDATLPLVYLNFQDKQMIAYNNTNNYLLYNSSNMSYDSITNVTVFNTEIPGYSINNSFALISSLNTYIYYVNQNELINVLRFINKGFSLHLAFKASKMINVPLFYFGNQTKGYLNVFLYCGCIYVVVGEGAFNIQLYTYDNFNANTWYILDVVGRISYGKIGFEIYVNGVRQGVISRYQNVLYYDSNVLLEYKSLLNYGLETTGLYIGGINVRNSSNNYNNVGYDIGAVLNTTYYTNNSNYYDYVGVGLKTAVGNLNILTASPTTSALFNSYISQANDNKYWAYHRSIYLTSNELADYNYYIDNSSNISLSGVNLVDINSMLIEVLANFYVEEEGFYYFALELQNEISCELVLSAPNNLNITENLVVSYYYGGSLSNPVNTINNSRVTQYPIKLNAGYYKLSLKNLRKPVNTKFITAKYFKYDTYIGISYSLLSKNITYINYTSLNQTVRNNMTDMGSKFYINRNNTISKFVDTNPILVGEDYGVFALGASVSSNAMGVGSNIFNSNTLLNVLGSNDVVKQFSNISDVSVGINHTLALLNDGTVYSCGANNAGQLGQGLTIDNSANRVLKQVKGLDGAGFITNIIQISAGDTHSLFVRNDGSLYGCGLNIFGQLGIGNTTYAFNVLKQSSVTNVSYVSAGVNTSLVIKNDGTAWGCGRNDTGQLAQGVIYTLASSFIPIMDVGYSNQMSNVKQVQAGRAWSLFLKNDGTCYASGGSSNIRSMYAILTGNTCNYAITYTSNYNVNLTSNYNIETSSNYSIQYTGTSNYIIQYTSNYTVIGTSNYDLELTSNYSIEYTDENASNYIIEYTSNYTEPTSSNYEIEVSSNYSIEYTDNSNYTIQYTSNYTVPTSSNYSMIFGSNYNLNFTSNVPYSNIMQISAKADSGALFLSSNGDVFNSSSNVINIGYLSKVSTSNIIQVLHSTSPYFINNSNEIYSFVNVGSGNPNNAVYCAGLTGSSTSVATTNNYAVIQVLGPSGSGYILGVRQVAGSTSHSLFLKNDGTVYATGANSYGQLGIGSTTSTSYLTQVKGVNGVGFITDVVQVASHIMQNNHSVFLKSDGTAYACGVNNVVIYGYGQIGQNDTSTAYFATLQQVKGVGGAGYLDNIKYIAAGGLQSFFIKNDGSVYGCGANHDSTYGTGQLGLGKTGNYYSVQQIKGVNGIGFLTDIAGVIGGWSITYFYKSDGTLYDIDSDTFFPKIVTEVSGIIGGATGWYHTIVVKNDGTCYAKGGNNYGQLGLNNTTSYSTFQQVRFITDIKQVAVGEYHSLFLKTNGTVYACGGNKDTWNHGALGLNDSTTLQFNSLQQVKGVNGIGVLTDIGYISALSKSSLFMQNGLNYSYIFQKLNILNAITQTLHVAGRNGWGQLGLGDSINRNIFTPISSITGVIQISSSVIHTLFLKNDGTVYACGNNGNGQLGVSDGQHKNIPTLIANLSSIIQVSAGMDFSLFLKNNGSVFACGSGGYGRLGFGDTAPRYNPQQIPSLSGIIQVVACYYHSLFLKLDGTVYSCGRNDNGQLGLNDNAERSVPTLITSLSDVVKITGGIDFSFFLLKDCSLYSCGNNASGVLALGDNINRNVPTKITALAAFTISDISCRASHLLILVSELEMVFACGTNNSYQLGLGDNLNRNTPTIIRSLTNVTNIFAGNEFSLFVINNNILYSCGNNSYGQLCLGDTINRTVPTKANVIINKIFFSNSGIYAMIPSNVITNYINPTNITKISAYNHVVVVDINHLAYSLGNNTYGQLANNDSVNQQTFQNIIDGEGRYNAKNIIKIVPYCNGNSSNLVTSAEYSLFLSSDGLVYFSGEGGNHSVIHSIPYLTQFSSLKKMKIVDIACGGSDTNGYYDYNIFLTNTGNVLCIPLYNFIKDSTGSNLSNIIKIGCRKNNWLMYFINKGGFIFQSTASVSNNVFNVSPATNVVGLGGQGIMRNIRQVEGGLSYTIFLSNSGEVYVLGDNTYGQLGTGDNLTVTVPSYMKGLNGLGNITDIVRISCGNYYTLLLTKNTKVLATGFNQGGILGIGNTSNTNVLKEVLAIDGSQALTGIKDISCGVANITPLVAAVLLLGQNNSIYINGASTATTGLLTLLNTSYSINKTINSVHAAGTWLFLNTIKYDSKILYDSSNTFTTQYDEVNSPNFYLYDSNYTINIQDVRMYTPDVMGTSNIIINELSKGIYNPSTNPAPNNIIYNNNTSFDYSTYYSGYASLAFNSSNSSFAYLQPNFYNFGANDTTISMWIKGSDSALKYPLRSFTSNDNNAYCISSSSSNTNIWQCLDNNSNTSIVMNSYTQIYSIGYNNVGQLGDNSTTNRTSGYIPMIVPGDDNTIIQIAGTANTTGWNVHMLSDTGRAYRVNSTGLALVSPNNFNGEKISFLASGRSTYFITESAMLYAYGDNSYWQLGNGNNTTQNAPILIASSRWNGEKVTYVATGNYHTFIITESGAIFSIGYNNNGQLGTGNTTNQTTWTLFTSLTNVLRIYCCGDQTYMITTSGLLYSMGVRGNTPFLETSIPSNKRIIKVSFSPGNCAFALADDGTVYGYGNNPISMPNTSSTQTSFIEITSTVWQGSKIVDVVTGGDHTFYITDRGLIYVVGNNNYGQLNIPTSTGSSKTPILVNVGGSRINLVYGGLSTTAYNIVVTYPNKRFIEFDGNKGEFIKADILESVPINYAQISLMTPASTTPLSYVISAKLYATNANNFADVNILWNLLGSYDGTLSYSANQQSINIVPSSAVSYRYYAVVINSRYNININEIGFYVNSSINSSKTIFDAALNQSSRINITLQSSNIIATVVKNNVSKSITVSNPNIYNKGVIYTVSYKYNTDPEDATWRVYMNGLVSREVQPFPYPESGNYSNIYIGRSIYATNTVLNYFTGNVDDFRIYNRALTNDEVISISSSDKFNLEGNMNNINKFALTSGRENFVYNVNYNDIYGMLKNMDSNGFTIHFLFKTNNVNNSALYYVGGNKTSKITMKVLSGVLYISLGNTIGIVTKNKINVNNWYIVDLLGNMNTNNSMTIQLYLNGIIQDIYINNLLTNSHTMNYSNLIAPDNSPMFGMYLGANYINNNVYRDVNDFTKGMIFTNTYFSCNLISVNTLNNFPDVVKRTATNAADFSNMIVTSDLYYSYKISCNVFSPDSNYIFNYDGSNYLYDAYITSNNNTTTFILNEIDASVMLSEGYYYFVNDIAIGDITAELYLGTEVDSTVKDFTNVANYYGSNLGGVMIAGLNRTTSLPVYVPDGFYKFHSKIYSRLNRIHLHHKFIKLDNYNGEYYSLASHFVNYQAYNSLDIHVQNQATTIAPNLYISKASSNSIMMDVGGSLDASLYAWGTSTYTYDNGVVSRGNTDGSGLSYVNLLNLGQPNGALLQNWSFFTANTGRAITPLIVEFTSGTNYILRGIGRTRTPTVTGVQTFAFDTVGGSNLFLTSNYRFAWRNGTTNTTNAGNIVYDNNNTVSQSTFLMTSPASITTGSTYSFSSSGGNRTYSFELEFAVNKNHQFGDTIYAGSNYVLYYTSNFPTVLSSNYSINYTSNYSITYTSNYNSNFTSNYNIAYSSNYQIAYSSNYSIVFTSNYNIEYTSNYSLDYTSNYSIDASSNYTLEYTSNYFEFSSNYSIEYTSNYNVDVSSNYNIEYTSNYSIEYTSNYTVDASSNYTIDYTSNYGDNETSNYTIEYTSNYTIDNGSNYTIEDTSNYSIEYTSNYVIEVGSNYNIDYTSNYGELSSNYNIEYTSNYIYDVSSNYIIEYASNYVIGYASNYTVAYASNYSLPATSNYSIEYGSNYVRQLLSNYSLGYASNYTINYTSNYVKILSSNYSIASVSNYIIDYSSNYSIEYSSNYTIDYSSNYDQQSSNYTIGYTSNYISYMTSNYTIEYTSNYMIEYTSNYTIDTTSNYTNEYSSNYTVDYTSNYGDNETSNYIIEYSSNYTVEYSSNYTLDSTSNYSVENISNYNIEYSSNYTIDSVSNYSLEYSSNYWLQVSNYTVVYTSNYNMDYTSNYSLDDTSNYIAVYTSNYVDISTSNYNILYTSNYIVPYIPNYLLPQQVFDFNNIMYMKGVSSIAHGSAHTIILKHTGAVFSCGWNNYGQLGIGNTTFYDRFMPVLDVGGSNFLSDVSAISCGALCSHFVKRNGTVFGCGLNLYGNLGDNTTTQRNSLVQVVGVGASGVLTDIKQVASGFGNNNVTLFLKNDGTVYGCGNNVFGTLGDNTTTQRNAPVQMVDVGALGFINNVKQICVNSSTTMLLKNDGTVFACGANTFGQIGDNSYIQRNSVVQVRGVGGAGFLSNIIQVAASGASSHSLFLRGDGAVYGCGFNGFGQLGRNDTVSIPYVMRVMSSDGNGTINGIIQIANNANTSYFLRYDGTLMSCGGGDITMSSNYANVSQLGNGFTSNVLLPKSVYDSYGSNIMRGISQLSVGGVNTITAVFNNGNKELVRSSNLYIIQSENDNTNVLIQDFRIYNTGSVTSNILSVYATGNSTVLVNAYNTYNEITDANRWMRSKDYYLYQNGVLNRSVYYNEGNVGIGTTAPTASLDIFTSDATLYSIKTNNAIWAQTGVISSSDARIKKNIVDIDDLAALNQILKIEPKTYDYIDKNRGKNTVYGFLAQQIKDVIPQAVEMQTESIPNIYHTAKVQDKNVVVFDNIVSDKVYVGCMIDIIGIDGLKIRCQVLEVVNDHIIRLDRNFEELNVFVYGTVVDDFHALDKSYIFTLNVCATQDLYRQMQNNKNKLEEQNSRLEVLMKKLNEVSNTI